MIWAGKVVANNIPPRLFFSSFFFFFLFLSFEQMKSDGERARSVAFVGLGMPTVWYVGVLLLDVDFCTPFFSLVLLWFCSFLFFFLLKM